MCPPNNLYSWTVTEEDKWVKAKREKNQRELKGKETETQAKSLKRRKRTHRAKPQIIRPERETRCSQGRMQLD